MKKRVFIMTVIIILVIQPMCSAVELSKYLNGRAVNVTENEDSIDIYALLSFVGDEKDDYVPNTAITYSEAFMLGVRYVWSGVYGWDWRHATDADYYILLKHRTWLHGNLFIYSSDRDLFKRYLPT